MGGKRDDEVVAGERADSRQTILDALLERVPAVVYAKDLAGRYVYANPGVEKQLDRPRDEIIGRTDYELFPADVADAFVANDRRALEAGRSIEATTSHDHGVAYRSIKFPLHAPDGSVVGIGGISTDLSAWREIETALAESETRFRQLAESIDNAVFWITDLPGRHVRYVSPAYERLWGFSAARLYADRNTWIEMIHPEDRVRAEEIFNSAGEVPFDIEYRIFLPNGQVRWIRDRGYPVAGRPAGLQRVAGIAEDITPRKLREERAARLHDLGAALSGAPDPAAVAAAVLTQALPALSARAGLVAALRGGPDPDDAVLHLLGQTGYAPDELAFGAESAIASPSMLLDALRVGGPVIDGVNIVLPLLVAGRAIGVIALRFQPSHRLDDEELDFLATLADLSAQALDRARLYAAEQAARTAAEDAEARYRSLFEGAADAIIVAGLDGLLHDANPAARSLLGYQRDDLLALRVADVMTGDSAWLNAQFERFLRDGIWQGEHLVRRKDGTIVPVESHARIVQTPAGPVQWMAMRDASARRKVEEALRLLAETGSALAASLDPGAAVGQLARLAVPALADFAAVFVVEGEHLHLAALAHVDPAREPVLHEYAAAHHPALTDPTSAAAAVTRTGVPQIIPEVTPEMIDRAVAAYPAARPSLALLDPRSAMIVPLRARGHILGAISLTTSRPDYHYGPADLLLAEEVARRAALALDQARLYRQAQEAEARYRGLFESLPDGVLVAGPDGRIQEVNAAAVHLLGFSRDELLAMHQNDLALTAGWSEEEETRFAATGQWRGEVTLRHKEGGELTVDAWIRRVDLASGPVSVVTMRDVTARKALERLQQGFLSSVSHDLKNPLSVIKGQAQYLMRQVRREGPPDLARLAKGLTTIEETVERTTDLIQELNDVARIQGGQALDLHLQPVDLVALARTAADAYQRTTERHHLRVETDEPALTGMFDGRRLERVIGNLLTNAIKYSPAGGEITLRIAVERGDDGARATLAIVDQGVGIPAGDLPFIFERFRRGANVRGIAGSGIGLAGVRQIVEQHGGSITVESSQGIGTTVTVRLPLALPGGAEQS